VIRILKAVHAEANYINVKYDVSLTHPKLVGRIEQADALIVVDHHTHKPLIGPDGLISAENLSALNNGLAVIHICGNVSQSDLSANEIYFWPETLAPPGHMSVSTDYVGPKPLIDLHTAGLKVGECLFHARKNGLAAFEAEMQVLETCDLALGFDGYHVKPRITT
jgi:hypothetical protein